MANTAAKKITYDNKPVQVESAIRDGSGLEIATNYAKGQGVTVGVSIPAPTSSDTNKALVVNSNGELIYDAPSGDFVTLDTAQTITGLKTIGNNDFNWNASYSHLNVKSTTFDTTHVPGSGDVDTWRYAIFMKDKNDKATGVLGWIRYVSNNLDVALLRNQRTINGSNVNKQIDVRIDSSGNGWAEAPTRTYNSANTNDIVTIGTMKNNAVTIADAQTITGQKTFTQNIISKGNSYLVSNNRDLSTITSTTLIGQLSIHAKNGDEDLEMARFQARRYGDRARAQVQCSNLSGQVAGVYVQSYDNSATNVIHISPQKERTLMSTDANGAVYTAPDQRAYNSSNTDDVVTIGTLKSSSDVVHITGTETITGYKIFNSGMPSSQPANGATSEPLKIQFYGGTLVGSEARWNYANIPWINKDNQTVGFHGPFQLGSNNSNGQNGFRIGLRDRADANWAQFLNLYSAGGMGWTGYIDVDKGVIASRVGNGYAQFRAVDGNYGYMIRNDGTNTYGLVTASGDPRGTWTSARPWTINNSTGVMNINGNAATATTSTWANNLWTTSHNGSWYFESNWDGAYFQTQCRDAGTNRLPINVGRANNSGQLDGKVYHWGYVDRYDDWRTNDVYHGCGTSNIRVLITAKGGNSSAPSNGFKVYNIDSNKFTIYQDAGSSTIVGYWWLAIVA